jgi:hypothetical protein
VIPVAAVWPAFSSLPPAPFLALLVLGPAFGSDSGAGEASTLPMDAAAAGSAAR